MAIVYYPYLNIVSFRFLVGVDEVKLPIEGQFEAFGKFIIYAKNYLKRAGIFLSAS